MKCLKSLKPLNPKHLFAMLPDFLYAVRIGTYKSIFSKEQAGVKVHNLWTDLAFIGFLGRPLSLSFHFLSIDC